MSTRQLLGFMLLVAAYGMLIPGLTLPVLHITTLLDKAELTLLGKEAILTSDSIPNFLMPMTIEVLNSIDVQGTVIIQDTAKSLISTAEGLWQDGNRLVAFLILFFSVVIPVIKLGLLALSYGLPRFGWAQSLGALSAALSKWSMADVFVMALVISFLAIKASASSSGLIQTNIALEAGFYYFLGYCLLSIASSQLLSQSVEVKSLSR